MRFLSARLNTQTTRGASPPSKYPSKSHIEGVAKLVNQVAPRKTLSETSGKIFADSTKLQLQADSRRQKRPALDLRSYQRFRPATPRSHHQRSIAFFRCRPTLSSSPPVKTGDRRFTRCACTTNPAAPAKRSGFRCTARVRTYVTADSQASAVRKITENHPPALPS